MVLNEFACSVGINQYHSLIIDYRRHLLRITENPRSKIEHDENRDKIVRKISLTRVACKIS